MYPFLVKKIIFMKTKKTHLTHFPRFSMLHTEKSYELCM